MSQLDDARRKWQKDGAGEHLARCFSLLDRMEASQIIATNGSGNWTRFDPNIQATRSGKTSTNAARRAKGRKTQDEREYGLRCRILLEDFQITEGQILALYAEQGDEGFSPEGFDPDLMPEPAEMPAPTPPAARQKKDRLAWVTTMQQLATHYAARKAGAK